MRTRIIYQPTSFLMKPLIFIILLFAFPNFIQAQQGLFITFQKSESKYQKTFKLPVSLRCVMHDGNVQIMQLDSIADDILYGNGGLNSIPINHIKVIHIRGLTEISKITIVSINF